MYYLGIVLLGGAAICALLLLVPYIFYPMVLSFLPTRPVRTNGNNADHRKISLLFSAFNEEDSLVEKFENLKDLKAAYPKLEILAYDDCSDDRTLEMLFQCPSIDVVLTSDRRCGKASGMKRMAAQAKGEILVFTDANVLLHSGSLEALNRYYNDPEVGGVCGSLRYTGEGSSATAKVGGQYWRLEERIKDQESRTGSVMGADGSIFSIRANLYPEFPDSVLDDFTASMEVVLQGQRLVKAEDVVAYERLISSGADEYRRKIRIGTRAFHTHRWLAGRLAKASTPTRARYFAHKTLRWFGGLLAGCSIAGSVLGGLLAFPRVTVTLLILTSITGLLLFFARRDVVRRLAEALSALWGTQVGVIRAMRGATVTTWSPSKTR